MVVEILLPVLLLALPAAVLVTRELIREARTNREFAEIIDASFSEPAWKPTPSSTPFFCVDPRK